MENDEIKPRPRNAYTRRDRRNEKREIEDALSAMSKPQTDDLTFDSCELDAVVGFSPDWML